MQVLNRKSLTKNAFTRLGLIIIPLLLLSSCVTTQEDVLYLNNQIAALNARVRNLDNKLSGDLKSIRENQADVGAEVDGIRGELQEISGRLEDNRELVKRAVERDTTGQDVMQSNLADLTKRIDALEINIRQVQEYLGLEPAAEIQERTLAHHPETTVSPELQVESGEKGVSPEKALYDHTLSIYKEGKYEEAISGFNRFIDKYPKSDLDDNAQFWIGECYMALKQFEQAILAYQEVIKKYGKGNKVPNAMLRQAFAFYEINDKTSARLLLKKIIKKYPKSNEAKIAKVKLATMK